MTAFDNQTKVKFPVYQGEDRIAANNIKLGKFSIDGIPPGPRGKEQFIVEFSFDDNGILNVKATNKSTGKSEQITIENYKRKLTKEETEEERKGAKIKTKTPRDVKEKQKASQAFRRDIDQAERRIRSENPSNAKDALNEIANAKSFLSILYNKSSDEIRDVHRMTMENIENYLKKKSYGKNDGNRDFQNSSEQNETETQPPENNIERNVEEQDLKTVEIEKPKRKSSTKIILIVVGAVVVLVVSVFFVLLGVGFIGNARISSDFMKQ